MSRDAIAVGRVLSVNVGTPRGVEWDGQTVRTAIVKEPVEGARMVRRINIDGDDQADRAAHGGEHRAVFVYQIESYRHWERELGRDDFTYGQFGENLTVEGLADAEVCIGDRYRIGDAVLEVTQPRVTCFRVGIRLRDPRMPSLLVSHHRPGFYLRVIREGALQAGDEIVRVRRGPERLSVADADALLYLPRRRRGELERALRIPALSEGWRSSFQALLEGRSTGGEPPAGPAWAGFAPLTVSAVTRESATITSFTLSPAAGTPAPDGGALPGQYLTLRLTPQGPGGPPLLRSYSLSRPAGADGYRISVKREPQGAGSSWMHDHVAVGDIIETAAPRGAFTLRAGSRPIVLLSAGVGITPVLAILHELAAARSPRELWWLHGARDRGELAFASEVDELLAALPHAHRIVSLSRPAPGAERGAHVDAVGRLSVETLATAGIPADADHYVCGADAFMRSLAAGLAARGTPPERIVTETFGAATPTPPPGVDTERPAPHPPDGPGGAGPPVTFSRSDLTVAWDARFDNLLELAEACDVPVSFGCRTGVCHYCETGLLDGGVTYVTEPLEAPDDEHVLVCCAQPRSGLVLEL